MSPQQLPPPADPFAKQRYTLAQHCGPNVSTPDSGLPQRSTAQLEESLFTSRQNDDAKVLPCRTSSVRLFRLRTQKAPLQFISAAQKVQLSLKRAPIRNKHRSLVPTATRYILFSLSSCYIPRKKAPYSGFVFVTK